MAKIIYKYIKESFGAHNWYLNKRGSIDEFAYSYEFHNGPMCKRCGYSFCIHCDPDGYNDKECVIEKEKYLCPGCNKDITVFSIYKERVHYCPLCGEHIEWPNEDEIKNVKEK